MSTTYTDIELQTEEVDQSRIMRSSVSYAVGDRGGLESTSEAYRHPWTFKRRGMGDYLLTGWPEMRPDSKAWLAAGEAIVLGDATAGSFLGLAPFTVHNVVPESGQIRFRLNIEWPDPLAILIDFWVIHFV
ncbi:hypothetical protein HUT19_08635 [Streptomyces sp. NA02950]|uniref:hypothetical protein n=1 Tax=Streptomyces sp. NA02950 TaxID=2742137 RepID=UPI001590EAB7|nr:hypothetical protein [Streptomyces sp. NA02950]QKV91799.1 hypothetical protein HUT19_08635 [Streptomyces sp. NA02950]